LFAVLAWMMSLPTSQQQRLWQHQHDMDPRQRMVYVTTSLGKVFSGH
jgi:hypothetical protein